MARQHAAGSKTSQPPPGVAGYDPDVTEARRDPGSKRRRRRSFTPLYCRLMMDSLGEPDQVKRTKLLLTAIVMLLGVIFFMKLSANGGTEGKETNPYILAASWPVPRSMPKVQRTAHLELQSFCKAAMQGHTTPPTFVDLDWSQQGSLASMALPEDNSILPSARQGVASLVKVDGIQQMDMQQGSYSVYVFRNRGVGDHDIVSNDMLMTKGWEKLSVYTHIGHLDALARELNVPRSEVYFVDIGANIGSFTLGVASAGFSVIAIEAMSVNQYALSLSLCVNVGMGAAVTVLPVALSKEKAQCAVYSAKHNVLDGTIRCDQAGMANLAGQGMVKRQDVDVVRLDDILEDWLPALKGRVGSLKMDTEGFEPWVVEGGKKFFSEVRPRFMQLEVSAMSEAATNVKATDLLEELVSYGYELRESAFSRPIRPKDIKIAPVSNPANVYLYAQKLPEEKEN